MRMPSKLKTQEKMMDQELITMKADASKLFSFGQKQSDEYVAAAEKFNAAAIAKLGKKNCGFLLLVTK